MWDWVRNTQSSKSNYWCSRPNIWPEMFKTWSWVNYVHEWSITKFKYPIIYKFNNCLTQVGLGKMVYDHLNTEIQTQGKMHL